MVFLLMFGSVWENNTSFSSLSFLMRFWDLRKYQMSRGRTLWFLYLQTRDILNNSVNYKDIKRMIHFVKLWEKVIEYRIR